MRSIVIRPATRHDAADLAILDNIASHGISLWYWQQAVIQGRATDAYDWGRLRMMDGEAIFGWRNAVVAELDGQVAGVATGYVMPAGDDSDVKPDVSVFGPIFELFNLAKGDWLLDSFAVYRQCRENGVGDTLLGNCFSRAQQAGVSTMSLVAEDGNQLAMKFYQNRGFRPRANRPYIPFNDTSKSKNWVLYSTSVN